MSKATLFDSRIKKYAYCKPPEICRDLGTSALGLSKEQVDAMRERYGKNSFQERKTDTTIQRLRRAFINPFHVILFILGIVSLVTDVFMASNFTRNATTALIIFSMIVISGIIRLIQELRAKSTAAQLDRLIHEKVTVRRNGELREIPGEELVVGDLVLFSAGDRVPAGRGGRGHRHGALPARKLRLCGALSAGQKAPHPHHTGRIFRGRHEACADAGLFAVHHHRAGQRDDHCHERRASALRRRGAGRRSGDLRHHRPKLHARCDDAAGRHHRGHAVYFKL